MQETVAMALMHAFGCTHVTLDNAMLAKHPSSWTGEKGMVKTTTLGRTLCGKDTRVTMPKELTFCGHFSTPDAPAANVCYMCTYIYIQPTAHIINISPNINMSPPHPNPHQGEEDQHPPPPRVA
jgi:hypothetical protein